MTDDRKLETASDRLHPAYVHHDPVLHALGVIMNLTVRQYLDLSRILDAQFDNDGDDED